MVLKWNHVPSTHYAVQIYAILIYAGPYRPYRVPKDRGFSETINDSTEDRMFRVKDGQRELSLSGRIKKYCQEVSRFQTTKPEVL